MPNSPQIPLPAIHWCDPIPGDDRDPVRRWQAHLDAGRLGANPPTPPAVAANRAATDALFRTFPWARTQGVRA